ncbi:hypothetical protein KJ693_03075, partial [bacterium]|nr:hypothetical protein [bacterium]MBU1614273.1 hypothetical protein [bacterium]
EGAKVRIVSRIKIWMLKATSWGLWAGVTPISKRGRTKSTAKAGLAAKENKKNRTQIDRINFR